MGMEEDNITLKLEINELKITMEEHGKDIKNKVYEYNLGIENEENGEAVQHEKDEREAGWPGRHNKKK